jgi:heat shock protein HslJ
MTSVSKNEIKTMEIKMKKSLSLCLTLLVIAVSMLTACAGTATTSSLAGDWKLKAYGSPANPTPADPNVDTSLTFGSDGKLNGNVGCNSFNGDYKVIGNTITFGTIASTMMACADPIMQQEGTVFNVFIKSATFKIDGNTLTVTSADGKSSVVLEHK